LYLHLLFSILESDVHAGSSFLEDFAEHRQKIYRKLRKPNNDKFSGAFFSNFVCSVFWQSSVARNFTAFTWISR
jgi:hypothetical protein